MTDTTTTMTTTTVPVAPQRVDAAAFSLFAYQAKEWDLPEAAARFEWDRDGDLRDFWRGQVRVVLDSIGVEHG